MPDAEFVTATGFASFGSSDQPQKPDARSPTPYSYRSASIGSSFDAFAAG
jgi:hypothetical protein